MENGIVGISVHSETQESVSTDAKILSLLITNPEFCDRIFSAVLDCPYEKNQYQNIVWGWAKSFHEKYKAPMREDVQTIFEKWSFRADKDHVRLVEHLLSNLSNACPEGASVNVDFWVDKAEHRFNHLKYRDLNTSLSDAIESGNIATANKLVSEFKEVSMLSVDGDNWIRNVENIKRGFNLEYNNLVQWDGALKEFFDNQMIREGFIAFQAPEKSGKSFWILETGIRAVRSGCNVIYFETGDMSETQVIRRLACRITGTPLYSRYLSGVTIPNNIFIRKGDQIATVEHDIKKFDHVLTWEEAAKSINNLLDRYKHGDSDSFYIKCFPNDTARVSDLENYLSLLEREKGFVPDIILIDYADLMLAEKQTNNRRDDINSVWKSLRRLSQERKCLIVTASQADAASYSATVQTKANFSECHLKLAHVTGMIGINQTSDEKTSGIQRLNWIAQREGDLESNRCVHVAGQLAIGRPAICSFL